MDYVARWLELKFLSGTQLDLFNRLMVTTANGGADCDGTDHGASSMRQVRKSN